MKFWYRLLHGLVAVLAASCAGFWPVRGAIVILGLGCILWLAIKFLGHSAEKAMKRLPFYLDRYWADGERDALERYAFYWLKPALSRRLGRVASLAAMVLLGAALPWLFVAWGLSAVALLFVIALLRWYRYLDPISWLKMRTDAKDYTVSDEWENVMNLRQKLIHEDWPWN